MTDPSYRPEIDGLRALAVLAVVAYHADLPGFSGGFAGVDVFFVLSGFLITGLLAREVEGRGRLSVSGFYGRRFRRLLPVAALVTVATVAVGWFVVSPLRHRDLAADALATSSYTINLRLAAQQLDYLRAHLAPSPFQQFWSLAVEEQFYLFWPLVLWLVFRGARPRRRAALAVAGLAGASFLLAQRWVVTAPSWAFFSLPTRAWQLCAGALVALAWRPLSARLSHRVRAAAAVAGLVAIAATVVRAGGSTPWPGAWAVVPTLATVLVLLAPPAADGGVSALLAARPLRAVGVRSYSWYLWHWPAMVFVAIALDREVGGPPAVAAAGVAFVLAAATYRWVEQPVRRDPRLVAAPRLSLALGLGVTGVLIAVFVGLVAAQGEIVGPGQAAADVARRSVDAQALDRAALVDEVPANLTPGLAGADQDFPPVYEDGCHLTALETTPRRCRYGDPEGDRTVVVLGDSHAAQWVPALDALGRREGVTVVPLTKAGCPAAAVTVHDGALGRAFRECDEWRAAALDLAADLAPDLVLVTNTSRYAVDAQGRAPAADEWRDGFSATLDTLAAAAPTVVLGDTPYPEGWVPDCLAEHLDRATDCVRARADLDDGGFGAVARSAADDAGAVYAPTTDLACGATWCPVIVGNQLVYRDDSHLTTGYVRRLADPLAAVLAAAVPDGSPFGS
ncbi:MAG: acyltransferase [Acidimicrobiales bacterium]|nr:acyltransferase [Acidimicrobiales bacterium]